MSSETQETSKAFRKIFNKHKKTQENALEESRIITSPNLTFDTATLRCIKVLIQYRDALNALNEEVSEIIGHKIL